MKVTRKLSLFMFLIIFVAQSVLAGSGFPAVPAGSGQIENDASADYGQTVNDAVYGRTDNQLKNTLNSTAIEENILTDFELTFGDGSPLPLPPNPLPNPIETELEMMVKYEFALPNDHPYLAGYTYTFNLPEQLVVYNEINGSLGEYGTYRVSENGTVVLTFNDRIETNWDIHGWFTFRSFIDRELTGPTEQTITVPISGDASIVIPLLFNVKGNSIDKKGFPDRYYNASTITWQIDFNKDRSELENVNLIDLIDDPNLQFVSNSIRIYELDVQVDGSVIQGLDVTNQYSDTFPIDFDYIDRQAYRVVFETNITDEDALTYSNIATLTAAGGVNLDASASVGIIRGKPIDKRSTHYNAETQTITWEVKYNYNEKSIPQAQAYVFDQFDANQELIPGSVQIFEAHIDPETGEEIGQTAVSNAAYTITELPSGDGFTLQFNDAIDRAYKVIYETTATERVFTDTMITNDVETGTGFHASGNRQIYQGVFVKSHLIESTDYSSKTTSWRLMLNNDLYTMNNVVLTDTLPQGMRLDRYTITHGGSSLTEHADYTFSYNPVTRNIVFTFDRAITERVVIEYDTTFNYNEMAPGQISFTNDALLTWTDPVNGSQSKSAQATFTPNEATQLNGAKGGSYNAQTKMITWTIGINYNNRVINEAIVEDVIEGKQQLIPGSIEVYNMRINSNGHWVKDEQLQPHEYTLQQITVDEKPGFRVNLGTITSPYVIEFTTSLENELIVKEYENEAVLKDGLTSFMLPAKVSVNNGGVYLDKDALQRAENEEILQWSMTINATQSTIVNAKVTDEPSANQLLLKDSFQLYDTNVAEDGTITKRNLLVENTDYELDLITDPITNKEYFELSFLSQISRPYILEYDTFLLAAHGESVSNDAKLTGDNVTTQIIPPKVHEVRYSTGDGGAVGKYGKLTVIKVGIDEDDELANETFLPGAQFTLFDKTGAIALYTGTTQVDGKVVLAPRIRFGEYILREMSVPPGYVAGAAELAGIPVTIDIEVSDLDPFAPHNEVKVTNKKVNQNVVLTKADDTDGTLLPGVVFELYQVGEPSPVEYMTNASGVIRIENMAPGDYYFVEKTPATDYLPNLAEYHFTIVENQTKSEAIKVSNKLIPGSATLRKVDADHPTAGLSGAEFEIRTTTGELVRKVSSDANGFVDTEDLRPGDYTIKEIKAPNGFNITNEHPFAFTIVRSQVSPLDLGTISNEVKTTSIEVTKKDSINGQLLEGAVYQLTYKSGSYSAVPQTGTTNSSGVITFHNLKPGVYELVETVAPNGYILNSTPIEIEVTLADVHTGKIVKETLTNEPFANVTLRKVDADTDYELAGAVFDVIDSATEMSVDGFTRFTTDANGRLSITGLPEGKYKLKEIAAPEGYKIQGTGITDEFEVVAGVTTELISIGNVANDIITGSVKLTKVDGDSDPLNRLRLKDVHFKLNAVSLVNGGTYTETPRITDSNGEIYLNNLRPGTYVFTEVAPLPGYQPYWGELEFTIGFNTGEHIDLEVRNYKLVDVNVTKQWNDNGDFAGLRPSQITVDLLRNDVKVSEAIVTPNWTYTFTNLPAVDENEQKYAYTVAEQKVDDYEREGTITGDAQTGYTITNVVLTSVTVEKAWEDDNDAAGDRPSFVTVQLLQNGNPYRTAQVQATESWQFTFDKLPVYAPNGDAYEYTVTENPVTGYEQKSIEKTSAGYEITNVRQGERTIEVEKVWLDVIDTQQRPDKITIELFRKLYDDAEYPVVPLAIQEIEPDLAGDWKHTFTTLPAFDANGKAYVYSVKEQPVAGYQTNVIDVNDENKYFVITNTRSGVTGLAGRKIWNDDNDATGDRPAEIEVNLLANGALVQVQTVSDTAGWTYAFTGLDEFDEFGRRIEYTVEEKDVPAGYVSTVHGYDITNTREGKIVVSGTKTWKDDNNPERPSTITVNLLRNGVHFDEIQVTAADGWAYSFTSLDQFDGDGVQYVYTVKEDPIPGYETVVTGYDITNVRAGKTQVEVSKVWKDDHAADRPLSINVNLLQNGTVVDTKSITAADGWTYVFDNLDEFDGDGKAYEYTVTEHGVPGYKTVITGSHQDGFIITNTRSELTDVTVTKSWKDDHHPDRPSSITVHLLRNGLPFDTAIITAAGGWTYTFGPLEAYDPDGEAYTYTVEEEAIADYEAVVTGYDITNVRVGKTSVAGTKTWKDDDHPDRPTSITVHLLRNGVPFDSATVTAADGWVYEFADLDAYDADGVAYEFTVEEVPVDGYTTEIVGYDLTNIRTGKIAVAGTKLWKDDGPQERPDNITVNLLRNGVQVATKTITSSMNWQYAFTNLDEFDGNGVRYNYEITEDDVDGYVSAVDGYDITNVRVGKKDISVTKKWKDDHNPNRPSSVTVNLLQNGTIIDTQTITAADDWMWTFTDLDAFDPDGKSYVYTVSEEAVPGYKTSITDYEITNIRSEQTSIVVKKHWTDDDQYPGRPESVTVHLLQNGVVFQSAQVTAADGWTYEFKNVEVFDDEGVAYKYEVSEDPVLGYVTTISGFELTNRLILGSVQLTKVDERKNNVTLEGAVFELQDAAGNSLQQGLTTDANGQFTVRDLQPGQYRLVETEAPQYYKLDPTPIVFTIKVGDGSTVSLVAKNAELIPPVPGRPGEPERPRNQEQPEEPREPNDPNDPNDPSESEDSSDPVNPEVPADTDEPADSSDSGGSENPGDFIETDDPLESDETDDGSGTSPIPSDPSESDDPTSADGSGTSPIPSDPSESEDPTSADGSGTSPIPSDPSESEDPTSADGSGTSAVPSDSADSAVPVDRGTLPNTATAIFNYGLLGAGALMTGVLLALIRRKRLKK